MKGQQTKAPIISNATILDRMFRFKPYTKCFDCLSDTRLKCKKCMANIIDDIEKKNQFNHKARFRFFQNTIQNQIKNNHQKKTPKIKLFQFQDLENKDQFVLKTKYEEWMEITKKRKRMKNSEFTKGLSKVRLKCNNLYENETNCPKFQKWEQKLLDHLNSRTMPP